MLSLLPVHLPSLSSCSAVNTSHVETMRPVFQLCTGLREQCLGCGVWGDDVNQCKCSSVYTTTRV